MRYYYNKANPNIEYGMIAAHKLNPISRKPNANGLVTYLYLSLVEPQSGKYYRNRDYYIIPVKVTPKVYAELIEQDRKEHNNNHKHDRRYLDIEKYIRQKGVLDQDDTDEINAWECVADKSTLNFEDEIIEELDRKAYISTLSKIDRQILALYDYGNSQKEIAKRLGKTQSFVSKRLAKLIHQIEFERLNDGTRSDKEIEFELAWKKFIYTHKMPNGIDVLVDTFNYLIGPELVEELLLWYYSFGEYYKTAYKILYLYEEDPNEDVLGHINELSYTYRYYFYERLENEADIFIWLYYCLVKEMERRKKLYSEPSQASYERFLDEQEKIAKNVKMTSEDFVKERFIPKFAPEIIKRNDDFLRANNVFVVDENTDIEAELIKIFGKSK